WSFPEPDLDSTAMIIPRSCVWLFAMAILATIAAAAPAEAQDTSLDAVCRDPLVVSAGGEATCLAAAQAAVSGQSALGILIAGGNPILGGAEPGGLGLGVASRFTLGLRLQVVAVELPDLLAEQVADELDFVDRFGAVAPA